jgi:hypothetical protein
VSIEVSAHAVDRTWAAEELDYFAGALERAIEHVEHDVFELRTAHAAALTASRFATVVGDARATQLLAATGQCGAGLHCAVTGRTPVELLIAGHVVTLASSLHAGSTDSVRWETSIEAATAVGDAASAVLLAEVPASILGPAPAWLSGLGEAFRAIWRGVGDADGLLLLALQATDPDHLDADDDVDRVLDLVVPAIAALHAVLAEEAIDDAVGAALERHREHWSPDGRARDEEGMLALPVAAACGLAVALGRPVQVRSAYLPPAGPVPPVLLCPVCGQPRHDGLHSCPWCRADLRADAPIEVSLGELLRAPATPCRSCATPLRGWALRCWSCSSSPAG